MSDETLVVGVDTGGTFTDFVFAHEDGLKIHKEPSTPENPAKAVLTGLQHLLGSREVDIVHGSTVATNAILERKGVRTILITTAGFEDVLEIGRQIRPAIYDLNVQKQPPLIPEADRLGVIERVGPHGDVVRPLDDKSVDRILDIIVESDAEAVAICLLHSYANPAHESRIAETLRERFAGFISTSHEVLPEFREYERCTTTVVNAYVGPIMHKYLSQLSEEVGGAKLRIMQSNGGVLSASAASAFAVQTVLSGPAGGAVGGHEIGRLAGFDNVITFDMGGTSTDVCLCPGEIGRTVESSIGDTPIRVPVIDIHTVGAGGGSIAHRDPGGSLRVGPQSAGAQPGPICYDRGGTAPTVTDANLFLGRLSSDHFLGGQTALATEPVTAAIETLSNELGLNSVETAQGILRVANATMERAIRVISLERGHDPRDFTLVCFGGAGGMHAADLARSLNIPRVLVPKGAGTLSALGMLLADFVRDYSKTLLASTASLDETALLDAFAKLEERARVEYEDEGLVKEDVTLERSCDMRYIGQGFELAVPFGASLQEDFHEAHERRYGYADKARATEIVNIRVRTVGKTPRPTIAEKPSGSSDSSAAVVGQTEMMFNGAEHKAPIYDHDLLRPGNTLNGPALVVEYSTTTVVPPDFWCRVDELDNLLLEPMP